LAQDLLMLADMLANLDPRRPRQANLRRAVSAAYYSLFHLLLEECSQTLAGNRIPGLAMRVSRSLSHTEMRKACLAMTAQPLQQPLDALLAAPVSHDLRLVAGRFVKLQELRHTADYDIATTITRAETLAHVDVTRAAFAAWRRIRATDEATIFLSALAFGARWSR
jgi:hypothetical protein